MNMRDKLETWLATNCRPVPEADNLIHSYQSGNLSFIIGAGPDEDRKSVDLVVKYDDTDYLQEISFFEGKKVELVSQQTILNTPFIVHSLIVENVPLKIIDFYQWLPQLVFYRILLIANDTSLINISIKSSNSNISRVENNLCISSNCGLEANLSKNSKSIEQADISVFRIEIAEQQPEQIFSEETYHILHTQISNCQKHHLCQTVRLRGSQAGETLAKLWSDQKIIFPDLNFNLQDPDFNLCIPWLFIISQLMQSDRLTKQLAESIYQKKIISSRERWVAKKLNLKIPASKIDKNHADPFDSFDKNTLGSQDDFQSLNFSEWAYVSYFTDLVFKDIIENELQKWWNLYSQPIFALKLKSMCNSKAELICVVILLAYRSGLKWAELLYELWRRSNPGALLDVVVQISRHIAIRTRSNGQVEIQPGNSWSQNSKEIVFQDKTGTVKFTRFGEKIISRLSHEKGILITCDREVGFNYSLENNTWSIAPNLNCPTVPNLCQIRYNGHLITVPFIWKKFEFSVNDIRFRVVFKHKRFQITSLCKNKNVQYEFNGQQYVFNKTQKHTFYFSSESRTPYTQFTINDSYYRSVLINSPNSKSLGYIMGWAFNRYGVMPENYLYSTAVKRHSIKSFSNGEFIGQFRYDEKIKEITVSFKHYQIAQPVNLLEDRVCSRLVTMNPQSSSSKLLLLFNSSQTNEISEILGWFAAHFDFYPEFLKLDNDHIDLRQFVQIKLISSHNEFTVSKEKGEIEVGIKKSWNNIENIFSYIKSCIN